MNNNNTYSSPADWVQCYDYERALTGESFGQVSSVAADATVVSTTITPAALNPEGRVSKPARRRRASRAAPTTLVNTDTSNFRAMVQQFTGVSNSSSSLTFAQRNINFRPISDQGYRNQYQQQQQQHQQQQQQQQQGYMLSLENRAGGEGFLSTRLSNNFEASDGFLMGNSSASSSPQMFPRASASSASHNNRINGW